MDTMLRQYEKEGFTRNQLEEIRKGMEAGVDVTLYAKRGFLAIQMQQIRLGLMNGIKAEEYARMDYDWFQMEEIRKGLEAGVNISAFASPDITFDRMQQIRLGLEAGIDLSAYKFLGAGVLKQMRIAVQNHVNIVPYIVTGYDAEQLEVIREALEEEIDIAPWVQKEYRGIALREILIGLENGLDVSAYAKVEYNWQQMRQIRLGIEHMVDIEQYNNPFYSYRQMREIRKGLEAGIEVSYYKSLMYTPLEMCKRRTALEENPAAFFKGSTERPEVIEKEWLDEAAPRNYIITISPDEMEAFIEVRKSLTEQDRVGIVKALYEQGICYGIRYEVIDNIIIGNSPRKPLLIARGNRQVDGKDGWYEFFFRTELMGIPKQLEDGSLDYREVEWFETVEKGQKLAVYHNSEKGTDGITITGRVIPAKRGREQSLLVGKGFKRLADGKTYISELQGIVTLQENKLNVSELLVMKEVNMTTGDVEYNGNILIEGNVSSGTRIRSTKDVIVQGFVEASQITCGGSVFLRKGMNGTGGGSIRAAKDVIGYFFEGVEVYAGGNIQGDYFFRTSLYAKGEIKAVGKKGIIAGGVICAENGIKVASIGNPAGLFTQVVLGRIRSIRQKEQKLNDTIRDVNHELSILQNAHKEFQKKYTPEVRNSMEIYMKIKSAIYTKERQLEALMQEKSGINEEIVNSGKVKATVMGHIYEGVNIEIDGATWQAKNLRGVTVKKSGNKIVLVSN